MNTQELTTKLSILTESKISEVVKLEGGFQNHVFSFQMGNDRFIARLTPIKKRSKALIEAELAFMESLKLHQIKTPEIVSIKEKRIYELCIHQERLWLTVFQFIDEKQIDVANLSQWNAPFFYEWGRTIAQIHKIDEETRIKIQRPNWLADKDGEVNPIPSLLNESEKWVKSIYENLLIKLASYPRTKHNFGLIHHDLHQGNFFKTFNQLILFDFDDCAYNYYVQDLATSIYHALWTGCSFHPQWFDFKQEFLNQFFKGYRSVKPLTKDDLVQIGLFLQLREVFLYMLFKKSWVSSELAEWQTEKIVELETNLRTNRIPYEQDLRNFVERNFS